MFLNDSVNDCENTRPANGRVDGWCHPPINESLDTYAYAY